MGSVKSWKWCLPILLAAALAPLAASAQYARIAVVHKDAVEGDGTYADLAAALDHAAVDAWCPNASAESPCLVMVMPGTYTHAAGTLVRMWPFIDVEGSGIGVTTIRGEGSAYGVLGIFAPNSELRKLTVEATSENAAILVSTGATGVRITDVEARATSTGKATAIAIGGTTTVAVLDRVTATATSTATGGNPIPTATGLYAGASAQVLLSNCTISASGAPITYAVWNESSRADGSPGLRIVGSRISASSGPGNSAIGIYNYGHVMEVIGSQVTASGSPEGAKAVYNALREGVHGGKITIHGSQLSATGTWPGSSTLVTWGKCTSLVGSTQLNGANPYTPYASGIVTCAASYDESFAPVPANCQ